MVVSILLIVESLLDIDPYLFNILGTSILFLIITILVILWTRNKLKSDQDPQLMFLTGGMALIRIIVSLVWMKIVQDSVDVLYKSIVIEFILIYLYYLFIDVVYLSNLFKP